MALIKERLQLDQIRMKSEVPAVATLQGERQQHVLRNGENTTRSGVGIVAGVVVRNQNVVRVVSTEKKKTDERFVIAGRVGNSGRAEPAQIENGVENARGAERSASGLANENATSRCVHIYLSIANSGELITR